MAESEDDLRQKLLTWKCALEAKGLKVNVSKTKLMFGGNCNKAAAWHVKYPCGVCSQGVGSNLILRTACGKWIHRPKRSSGIKGSLEKVQKFECSVCKAGITKQDEILGLRIGNDTSFERVETFCYFGDMLSSDGGCVSEG